MLEDLKSPRKLKTSSPGNPLKSGKFVKLMEVRCCCVSDSESFCKVESRAVCRSDSLENELQLFVSIHCKGDLLEEYLRGGSKTTLCYQKMCYAS